MARNVWRKLAIGAMVGNDRVRELNMNKLVESGVKETIAGLSSDPR